MRVRRILAFAVAGAAFLLALGFVMLRTTPPASDRWAEFSIASASGEGASLEPTGLRANGITVKAAIATAYGFPAVRVVGPAWISETRYAMTAVVDPADVDAFRPLLLDELERRLHLVTHTEMRRFDVFVLSVQGAPRVTRSAKLSPYVWIQQRDAELRGAPMSMLASTLQSILGMPVIDETGLPDTYDLRFEWDDDREASVRATLREHFGLQLTRDTRELETLVIDAIHPDVSLALLGHAGRRTRWLPSGMRRDLARVLTVR